MDDFVSLSNRLLTRCPAVGIELAEQLVNDSWQTLQARREWSFRRKSGTFAPATLYNTGYVSTNVASGQPTLLTGTNTNWTVDMVGRQIRVGGLLYPYYTLVAWLSPTAMLIDQPWAGPDVVTQSYDILQCFFTVPDDFNYFYAVVSIKDGFRLWTSMTGADLDMLDPQRTNTGQTYAIAFHDFSPIFGGVVGAVIPITSPTDPAPISTTEYGYSYVANATYILQVVTGGVTGTATFQWMRAGMTAFQPVGITSDQAQDLMDGVQVYWPDGVSYVQGDIFIINCTSQLSSGSQRVELWPAPTFNGYLYPYQYIAKESTLTVDTPQLPPLMASRGEVLLEMALEKCAEFPGSDIDHRNVYYDLRAAQYHAGKVRDMLVDLERNDEEVAESNIDFQTYPFYPSPWMDGNWQQQHAAWFGG